MIADYLDKQPVIAQTLINILNSDKLSHAYLFEVNNYTDDLKFVYAFIKNIICRNHEDNCSICKRIDDGNYPEIKVIEPDGLNIKKEQMLDLQKEFSTKAIEGKYKVYLIKQCELLNDYASNSILKFLEEPEENVIAILLTEHKEMLIDTIISRCQCYKLKSSNEIEVYETSLEVSKALDLIEHIEQDSLALCYPKTLLPATKEEFVKIIDIMVMYYKLKMYNSKELDYVFSNYLEKINAISIKFNLNKINYLINIKKLLYNNVNINLLFDKIIIDLKGENYE